VGVSVAELPVPYDDGGGPPSDRTPPQDVAAEQSVLGAMMLSKDAIADVVELLREGDFYRPAHATIYDAIISIYGKGDPADAVTVAAELTRTGEIGRIGEIPCPALDADAEFGFQPCAKDGEPIGAARHQQQIIALRGKPLGVNGADAR